MTAKQSAREFVGAFTNTVKVVPDVATELGNATKEVAKGVGTSARTIGAVARTAEEYAGGFLDQAIVDRATDKAFLEEEANALAEYISSEEGKVEMKSIAQLKVSARIAEARESIG